jgi:DNA-binding transcriptional ArsR family regulator
MDLPALTPRDLLGLLAEEDRLRVVAAIALGARTPAEIAAASGLELRTAVKALARLAAAGLVEEVREVTSGERGAGSGRYRVRTEVLRQAAAVQARTEPEPVGAAGGRGDDAAGEASGPDPSAGEAGGPDPSAAVLGRFVRGGKLLSIPTARSKRLLVLDHLAGLFEPGRRYTEAEVNRALGAWHPDYAALRRYLVDEGFLRRANEHDLSGGSRRLYWRTGGSFDVDQRD